MLFLKISYLLKKYQILKFIKKHEILLFLMQASGDFHIIIRFLTGSGQGGGGAGSKMTLLAASL